MACRRLFWEGLFFLLLHVDWHRSSAFCAPPTPPFLWSQCAFFAPLMFPVSPRPVQHIFCAPHKWFRGLLWPALCALTTPSIPPPIKLYWVPFIVSCFFPWHLFSVPHKCKTHRHMSVCYVFSFRPLTPEHHLPLPRTFAYESIVTHTILRQSHITHQHPQHALPYTQHSHINFAIFKEK